MGYQEGKRAVHSKDFESGDSYSSSQHRGARRTGRGGKDPEEVLDSGRKTLSKVKPSQSRSWAAKNLRATNDFIAFQALPDQRFLPPTGGNTEAVEKVHRLLGDPTKKQSPRHTFRQGKRESKSKMCRLHRRMAGPAPPGALAPGIWSRLQFSWSRSQRPALPGEAVSLGWGWDVVSR